MIGFPVKPAMRYETSDTAATVVAYGSCVVTCDRWLQDAPADAMIVVSEIGEQWSPYTAPAMHAAIIGVDSSGCELVIASPSGIRIPNVPHDEIGRAHV